MQKHNTIIFLMVLASNLAWATEPYRANLPQGVADGQRYTIVITNETFVGYPAWSPKQDDPPPLSPQKAYKLALAELIRLVNTPDVYQESEITLQRFFDTSSWYYNVVFICPNWELIEPYRTLLEKGEWKKSEMPVVWICVLFDGSIVKNYEFRGTHLDFGTKPKKD